MGHIAKMSLCHMGHAFQALKNALLRKKASLLQCVTTPKKRHFSDSSLVQKTSIRQTGVTWPKKPHFAYKRHFANATLGHKGHSFQTVKNALLRQKSVTWPKKGSLCQKIAIWPKNASLHKRSLTSLKHRHAFKVSSSLLSRFSNFSIFLPKWRFFGEVIHGSWKELCLWLSDV